MPRGAYTALATELSHPCFRVLPFPFSPFNCAPLLPPPPPRLPQPLDARRVAAARRQLLQPAEEQQDGTAAAAGGGTELRWRGRFFADAASSSSGRGGGDVLSPAHPAAAALRAGVLSAPLREALGLPDDAASPLDARIARFGAPPAYGGAPPPCSMHSLRCAAAYAGNGELSAIVAQYDAGCPLARGGGEGGGGGALCAEGLLLMPLFMPPQPQPPPLPPPQQQQQQQQPA